MMDLAHGHSQVTRETAASCMGIRIAIDRASGRPLGTHRARRLQMSRSCGCSGAAGVTALAGARGSLHLIALLHELSLHVSEQLLLL